MVILLYSLVGNVAAVMNLPMMGHISKCSFWLLKIVFIMTAMGFCGSDAMTVLNVFT